MERVNWFFVVILISIFHFSFLSAEEFGYNLIKPEAFDNNTAFVNASEHWNTISLGPLNDVNSTQHESNGGTLNIKESWLTTFGNGLWCSLFGCTMEGNTNQGGYNHTNIDYLQANSINATNYSNINFETINQINKIGNPTHIDDLQEIYNHMYSAGVMHDCNLTDNNDGTINISSGYATLRPINDSHSTLYSVEVNEQNNIALTDNKTNYVFLDWNTGTPQFNVGLSISDFNCQDKCVGYIISREGNNIDYLDVREQNVDSNRKLRRKELETGGFVHILGGSAIAGTALNISLTAGGFYYELTPTLHSAFDTSTGDTFDYYYTSDNGVTWQKTNTYEIDNLQYNDPGLGLVTLGNNKFKVDWVYVINNEPSRLAVLYGQEEFLKLADAEAAGIPEFAPASISGLGALVGRVIVEKSAVVMITESAFERTFTATTPTTHNGLSGLDGGALNEYYHFTLALYNEIVDWLGVVSLTDDGNLTGVNYLQSTIFNNTGNATIGERASIGTSNLSEILTVKVNVNEGFGILNQNDLLVTRFDRNVDGAGRFKLFDSSGDVKISFVANGVGFIEGANSIFGVRNNSQDYYFRVDTGLGSFFENGYVSVGSTTCDGKFCVNGSANITGDLIINDQIRFDSTYHKLGIGVIPEENDEEYIISLNGSSTQGLKIEIKDTNYTGSLDPTLQAFKNSLNIVDNSTSTKHNAISNRITFLNDDPFEGIFDAQWDTIGVLNEFSFTSIGSGTSRITELIGIQNSFIQNGVTDNMD